MFLPVTHVNLSQYGQNPAVVQRESLAQTAHFAPHSSYSYASGLTMNRFLTLFTLSAFSCLTQTNTYSYDAAGRLSTLTYPNGKIMSLVYDPAGNLLRRVVRDAAGNATPSATAAGVVNAASFLPGPVAPGELITIFGSSLGPVTLATFDLTSYGFFSTYVGDTSVNFDGIPAPVYYSSAGQTSVFVPYTIAGQPTTSMSIVYQGRSSAPISLSVVAAAPALFSVNSSGKGPGAILNQDSSVNSASNPAAQGSIVVLYGTGEGQTAPGGVAGRVVAGVFQVNVRIPDSTPSGAVPVVVKVGSASSQEGVTVAVK